MILHLDKFTQAQIIQKVLKECFWGDYKLTVDEILEKINNREAGFCEFIFSKILDNALYPSFYLRHLFDLQTIRMLFERREKMFIKNRRRFDIIKANALGEYSEFEGINWKL